MPLEISESLLRTIIQEELKENGHVCRFRVTDKEAIGITGHITWIKALGEGDMAHGVNIVHENHRYWAEQREFNASVSNTAKKVVIGLVTGGILYALWEGIRHFMIEGI
jgi:hypothetical protein